MDGDIASAGQRRGPLEASEDPALEALDLAWGAAYDVWVSGGQYLTRRIDGTGEPLTGASPDELDQAIRADRSREDTP